MNRVFLTLCFYEYPVAKVHIDFWENLVRDRIIEKIENDKLLLYIIRRGEDQEVLYCIRFNEIPKLNEVISTTIKVCHGCDMIYLKTLVFGKIVEIDILRCLKLTNDVQTFYPTISST